MKIYLVGGAVRDKLLNFAHHENDWVVIGSSPNELMAQGYIPVGKNFPVFLHPQTKEEYALARTERKSGVGYKGFTFYSGPDVTLEQDLKRRDLTINAMAMTIDGRIIDPYGGQNDLLHKQLRHVSPAFAEDPLRVLRVARFAARYHHLDFKITPDTLALMKKIAHSGELATLPVERVWKELARSLQEKTPTVFFLTLRECDALSALLPEITHDLTQTMQHLYNIAAYTSDPLIRFSALFCDMDNARMAKIHQRLIVPKAFKALAQLINRYAKDYQACGHHAKQQLLLLERLDAFRQPKRFQQFITGCEGLYPKNRQNGTVLKEALNMCLTVDTKPLVASNDGPAIAAKLHEERLKALEKNHA